MRKLSTKLPVEGSLLLLLVASLPSWDARQKRSLATPAPAPVMAKLSVSSSSSTAGPPCVTESEDQSRVAAVSSSIVEACHQVALACREAATTTDPASTIGFRIVTRPA